MKLRLSSAILTGKLAAKLSRVCGYGGSSFPGLLARLFYPGALKKLAAQVRKGIIVVTGTNGKTTTANMITGVLQEAGFKTISNREGANMISGITTSFIMNSIASGKIDCDYAVIEVDEASIPEVLNNLSPRLVVVTNFFQDQLDRYWELGQVIGIIRDSLLGQKQATLVLNADDPLVAQFQRTTGLPAYYFGLAGDKNPGKRDPAARETSLCPFCGSPLVYNYCHYGQLGAYSCPDCGFTRPRPQVEAMEAGAEGGYNLTYPGAPVPSIALEMQTQGLHNVYNALAAFSVSILLGVNLQTILVGLRKYRPAIGRMEKFRYGNKQVYLNLVKNSTGFNQGLETLCEDRGGGDVLIVLNDNFADSRDISWIWDVNFEMLTVRQKRLGCFICSGLRGEEMALRLKYAGIPTGKIVTNTSMNQAVKAVLRSNRRSTYIFSTYTALRPVHKIIESLVEKGDKSDQGMPSVS
ncbi:MAG: DUF1727 domain-containing protein [Peptococcaceae bacterium]|nr:DUF1727 domain-containing protein [Candidatus Syntrophopropionicum ammoniitolerans]